MKKILKKYDTISPKIGQELHFNQRVQQTSFGGFITIMMNVFMVIFTLSNVYDVFIFLKPYYSQAQRKLSQQEVADSSVDLSNLNRIIYQLLDPEFTQYSIDESKQYVQFEMHFIDEWSLPDGNRQQEKRVFHLEDCNAKMAEHDQNIDEYEKTFLNYYQKLNKAKFLCVN